MPRRFSATTVLFAVLLTALAACEGGPPWRSAGDEETAIDRDVFGPSAAYDRRLIFLGPGERLPTVLVFDFAALSDSVTLRRGVRGRLVDGAEWIPLLDAGWEMEPMREPWRVVPYGPLRVVVGEAGELDALLFRGDVDLRLEPGPTLAEHSPDAGTQLVLRQARLDLETGSTPGILLDAQLARAIRPPPPRLPGPDTMTGDTSDPPTTAAPDTGDDAEALAGADSTGDPAPAPRPGAEALLMDNSGYYAVFVASSGGDMAWLHTGGRDDVRRGSRLEPTEWEDHPESGTRVPTAWRIVTPGEGLSGELRSEGASRATLMEGAPGVMGYVIVSGYVEDRSIRRNVYGLIRHVR